MVGGAASIVVGNDEGAEGDSTAGNGGGAGGDSEVDDVGSAKTALAKASAITANRPVRMRMVMAPEQEVILEWEMTALPSGKAARSGS